MMWFSFQLAHSAGQDRAAGVTRLTRLIGSAADRVSGRPARSLALLLSDAMLLPGPAGDRYPGGRDGVGGRPKRANRRASPNTTIPPMPVVVPVRTTRAYAPWVPSPPPREAAAAGRPVGRPPRKAPRP